MDDSVNSEVTLDSQQTKRTAAQGTENKLFQCTLYIKYSVPKGKLI